MILVPFNSLFSHGKTNKMMKKITILFTFLCSILILEANEIWTKVSKEQLKSYKKVNRSSFPNKAEYFLLDIEALKIKLGNAPERFVQNTSDLIIEFPDSEGKLEKFKVVSSTQTPKGLNLRSSFFSNCFIKLIERGVGSYINTLHAYFFEISRSKSI
mgnify:CR=1 FL=1